MNNGSNTIFPKQAFAIWLEAEKARDPMIKIIGISNILRKLNKRLIAVNANRFEKRYLYEWIKLFRIDREIDRNKTYS